jgi:hypothetical protein
MLEAPTASRDILFTLEVLIVLGVNLWRLTDRTHDGHDLRGSREEEVIHASSSGDAD